VGTRGPLEHAVGRELPYRFVVTVLGAERREDRIVDERDHNRPAPTRSKTIWLSSWSCTPNSS
jgi:hypothetical protein